MDRKALMAASALIDPVAAPEKTPPLTDAFPKNPTSNHNVIEKKRKAKYLRRIRAYLNIRREGDSEQAQAALQKALDALDELCVWYSSPFIICEKGFTDKVEELYERLADELGVITTLQSRQGLPPSDYKDVPVDPEKLGSIKALTELYGMEPLFPVEMHCFLDSNAFDWADIAPGKNGESRKQTEKYDDLIDNRDDLTSFEYNAKCDSNRHHVKIIAAINRSARKSSPFSAAYDLEEAMRLCKLPQDKPIADRLRYNAAWMRYRYGLQQIRDDNTRWANDSFYEGVTLMRSCPKDFLSSTHYAASLEARLLKEFGDSALRHGDTVSAYDCYCKAETILQHKKAQPCDSLTLCGVYCGFALLALVTDNKEEALQHLHKASKACESIKNKKKDDKRADLYRAAVQFQTGCVKKDINLLQTAFEAFTELGDKACAAHVAKEYQSLFGAEPKIREPEPVPEPKPDPWLELKKEIEEELARELQPDGSYLIDGNIIPPGGRGLYINLRDFADGNPYIRYGGAVRREKLDRTKRRYEQLNIEYDAENDDDLFYNGDSRSAHEYGNMLEDNVNSYVRSGDMQNALEEAKLLVQARESAVESGGGYSLPEHWNARTMAICKLAWLKKSRSDYQRALDWEWRNPGKRTAMFLMMKRCGLAGEDDACKVLNHDWKDGKCARCSVTLRDEYEKLVALTACDSPGFDVWSFHSEYEGLVECIEEILYEKKFRDKAGSAANDTEEKLLYRLEHIDEEVPYKPEPYDPLWDEAGDYDPEEQFKKDMEALKWAQWVRSEALHYFLGKRKRRAEDHTAAAGHFEKAGTYHSAAAELDHCGKTEEARRICVEQMERHLLYADHFRDDLYKLMLCYLSFGALIRRAEPVRAGIGILESIMNQQDKVNDRDWELRGYARSLRDLLIK